MRLLTFGNVSFTIYPNRIAWYKCQQLTTNTLQKKTHSLIYKKSVEIIGFSYLFLRGFAYGDSIKFVYMFVLISQSYFNRYS